MTTPGAEGRRSDEVTLLTRWHFPRMRVMPWQFWRFRRLDHQTQHFTGRLWSHRWISRRSLLYSSTWSSDAEADRWLNSGEFRAFDRVARRAGAQHEVERYRRES